MTREEDIDFLVKKKIREINTRSIFPNTAPYDPRFPNQNQTRNCYQNYLDFHRCKKIKGDDYEPCQYFKRIYKDLCPPTWHQKWDEQIENGNFAGKI